MTQEEKDLLLKDLCGRLPYGMKCKFTDTFDGCEAYANINAGDWFIATDRNGGKHIGTQIEPIYCHKATVKEIIEHFKINDYGRFCNI